MKPKVSVMTTTYNHERYIAQAVESVVNQKTNFLIEMVVGEDCSTDQTRPILLALQEKHPFIIRPLLRESNWGRRRNFIDTLFTCEGQYIAILEGDDYWTDPEKLQRQAEFLDSHPNCAICFHPILKVPEDKTCPPWIFRPHPAKEIYTLEDLIRTNFIATCSVMFRSRLFTEFPPWYYDLPSGDWPLHILNAHHGDIGMIDRIMAAYRIHSGGVWSPHQATQRIADRITMLEVMRPWLAKPLKRSATRSLARTQILLAHATAIEKGFLPALLLLLKLPFQNPYRIPDYIQAGLAELRNAHSFR
ncbi:MAG: glycosyltransferase [Anaerolineales bacterium]|nr:glycosyltransferase [Anaerolineales bacterium]